MAAKFEMFKDKSGDFRFHLKATNGEVSAASQGNRHVQSRSGAADARY
jgi:uncharacterized protein